MTVHRKLLISVAAVAVALFVISNPFGDHHHGLGRHNELAARRWSDPVRRLAARRSPAHRAHGRRPDPGGAPFGRKPQVNIAGGVGGVSRLPRRRAVPPGSGQSC